MKSSWLMWGLLGLGVYLLMKNASAGNQITWQVNPTTGQLMPVGPSTPSLPALPATLVSPDITNNAGTNTNPAGTITTGGQVAWSIDPTTGNILPGGIDSGGATGVW